MKRVKAFLALCVVIAMAFSVTACGPSAPETETVAFSVWTMEWDFFQIMALGAEAAAKEAGVEIIIHDQKGDQTEQVSGATNLLNQGIIAFGISPFAPDAMPPIVDQAHALGIPVVISDIGTGGSDHDGFIFSDNFGGGVMNGEFALKMFEESNLTEKTYASLRSPPVGVVSQLRNDGAGQVLDAAGFTRVAEIHTDDTTEQGYSVMMDILAANPDISIVIASNDAVAAGVGQALLDAGRTDAIVTGFDASDQGIEGLRNGTIQATIQQFPYDMGYRAIMVALALAREESVTYDNPQMKEIHVAVSLVTANDIKNTLAEQPVSITGLTRGDIGMG